MPRSVLTILALALIPLFLGWGIGAPRHTHSACCCAPPTPAGDDVACCHPTPERPPEDASPRCLAGLCACPCPSRPPRAPSWPQAPARDAGGSLPTFPAPDARPMPPPPETPDPGTMRIGAVQPGLFGRACPERLCVWRT